LFEKHGFDYYVAMILQNPRSVIVLMSIFYDREDVDETERAKALYDDLFEAATASGYQQYRTSVAAMHRLYSGQPAYADMLQAIKTALDPDEVIAPGRYGIGGTSKAKTAANLSGVGRVLQGGGRS
jgi:4-cresol dehydrogenase (hydroxylating)